MSIWEKYTKEQQDEYISYIEMYSKLSKLFNQKSSETGAPYLDSKFQETIYAKSFNSDNVDIGNTPHDIMSKFSDNKNIGIGIKTWLNSSPSYQKVMQLKSISEKIDEYKSIDKAEGLANFLAKVKNRKLIADYNRLGLSSEENIYHYITRDSGRFLVQETSYPLVDVNKLTNYKFNVKNGKIISFNFEDGLKKYKYTFSDSQIWMKFGEKNDHTLLAQSSIQLVDDPFKFLKDAFEDKKGILIPAIKKVNYTYLPLYSFKSKKVEKKSGLNAFRSKPKDTNSNKPRPDAEVYIPIPKAYWKKFPDWFSSNKNFLKYEEDSTPYEFNLHLPNGMVYSAKITQSDFKGLETSPQNALGKWLLYDVLQMTEGERKPVEMELLYEIGYDSVKLWREDNDDSKEIYIDFAPLGSFERYMNDELTDESDDSID